VGDESVVKGDRTRSSKSWGDQRKEETDVRVSTKQNGGGGGEGVGCRNRREKEKLQRGIEGENKRSKRKDENV